MTRRASPRQVIGELLELVRDFGKVCGLNEKTVVAYNLLSYLDARGACTNEDGDWVSGLPINTYKNTVRPGSVQPLTGKKFELAPVSTHLCGNSGTF